MDVLFSNNFQSIQSVLATFEISKPQVLGIIPNVD